MPAAAAQVEVVHQVEADNAFCLTASVDGRHWGLKTVHAEGVRAWVDGEIIVEMGEMLDLGCPNYAFRGNSWYVEFQHGGSTYLFVDGVRYGPFVEIDAFSPRMSADGETWAAEVRAVEGVSIIVDGTAIGPFEDAGSLLFAPVGHRWAFVGSDGAGRWVITDGGRWGPFEVVGQATFSDDGEHWGVVVADPRGAFLVVDGALHGPWTAVADVAVAEGRWRAVVSVDGRQQIVEDGQAIEMEPEDEIVHAVLSTGGDSWGYGYRREDHHGVVIDGEERGRGFVRPVMPRFSSDGSAWACDGTGAEGGHVVSDRGAWGPFDEVLPPELSPGGEHLAFWLREGEQYFAMVDGERFGPFDDVYHGEQTRGGRRPYPFLFSPEGSRWAVLAERGAKTVVLVDGEERGPHGDAGGFVFGPGERWGYWIRRGLEAHAVIDGVEYGPYDEVGQVVFSADGASWGFVGYRNGREHPVLDGRDWGPLDYVNWSTAQDGVAGELAFTGRDGEKSNYVCAVGAKHGPYLEISPLRIMPGGGVVFFALRRGATPGTFEVVRVELR